MYYHLYILQQVTCKSYVGAFKRCLRVRGSKITSKQKYNCVLSPLRSRTSTYNIWTTLYLLEKVNLFSKMTNTMISIHWSLVTVQCMCQGSYWLFRNSFGYFRTSNDPYFQHFRWLSYLIDINPSISYFND